MVIIFPWSVTLSHMINIWVLYSLPAFMTAGALHVLPARPSVLHFCPFSNLHISTPCWWPWGWHRGIGPLAVSTGHNWPQGLAPGLPTPTRRATSSLPWPWNYSSWNICTFSSNFIFNHLWKFWCLSFQYSSRFLLCDYRMWQNLFLL